MMLTSLKAKLFPKKVSDKTKDHLSLTLKECINADYDSGNFEDQWYDISKEEKLCTKITEKEEKNQQIMKLLTAENGSEKWANYGSCNILEKETLVKKSKDGEKRSRKIVKLIPKLNEMEKRYTVLMEENTNLKGTYFQVIMGQGTLEAEIQHLQKLDDKILDKNQKDAYCNKVTMEKQILPSSVPAMKVRLDTLNKRKKDLLEKMRIQSIYSDYYMNELQQVDETFYNSKKQLYKYLMVAETEWKRMLCKIRMKQKTIRGMRLLISQLKEDIVSEIEQQQQLISQNGKMAEKANKEAASFIEDLRIKDNIILELYSEFQQLKEEKESYQNSILQTQENYHKIVNKTLDEVGLISCNNYRILKNLVQDRPSNQWKMLLNKVKGTCTLEKHFQFWSQEIYNLHQVVICLKTANNRLATDIKEIKVNIRQEIDNIESNLVAKAHEDNEISEPSIDEN